ncbi:MAG: hypothetical protein WC623_18340 [Pedobacter sp.]|uniref:hypothetical protein n=1 Tax=Pedobacter sp. TaxID=1411316 RepID=UPI0035625B28
MRHIKVLILFIVPICMVFKAKGMELEKIRINYEKAVSDKEICQAMIKQLSTNTDALHIAYLGAFQAVWAKHTINPISKLSTFKKGKKNIELAVKSRPDDAEIRFVRLSVQLNCPSFLGYSNKINEDKKIVQSNIHNIKSVVLKRMILVLI